MDSLTGPSSFGLWDGATVGGVTVVVCNAPPDSRELDLSGCAWWPFVVVTHPVVCIIKLDCLHLYFKTLQSKHLHSWNQLDVLRLLVQRPSQYSKRPFVWLGEFE